ncbi:MAG: septation protein A [Betaproteobacteria bacterium]|jgi:intracellular septation protein|nr:septation protein A [Betaproteobacteria bacterium]MCH9849100.1 septation protein A [Betaproteobacteria bacterium]
MKVFFDLFPVILFFIGFKLYDIFIATAIAIGATIAMIVYSKLRHGKVEKMLMINGAIISILGGITLLLHDKTYIMWKPTVLYWLMAAALLISNFFFKKNLIQQMMGKMLNPPAHIWQKLNWLWITFLIVLGFVNIYVFKHYSEDTWVNFKLFGVTSMMFVFMIAQTIALKDYLIEPAEGKQ